MSNETIELQNIAYVNAMTAAALVKMQGMVAANVNARITAEYETRRLPLPYQQEDFEKLIEDYGLHHNAVISNLRHGLY